MKCFRKYVGLTLLLLSNVTFVFHNLSGQCVIDTSIIIEPIDTVDVLLEIEGLSNNDLSSPSQGLCGVRLAFEHEYLGDIYIELISPSGQRIRLIGPEVTSGFTNLTDWDILFVPCGFPTAPDPGFSSQWDNDQTWGILNSYTGTYHPYSGCLEDFDTGPVNGTWTLRIVDRSLFYGGEITSITLIFCDPSGLDCNPCNADAGVWINEGSSETYCENDPALELDTTISYQGNTPDSNIYDYVWTIYAPDTLIEIADLPDLRGFVPGEYTVCGLSFRKDEIALLPDVTDSIRLDSLEAQLAGGDPPFCGDQTSGCMRVTIVASPDTITIDTNFCRGESFAFGRDTFYSPGTYIINRPGVTGCDSVFRIQLNEVILNARISGADTLNCSNPIVELDASGSDTITGTIFNWFVNGFAVDPGADRDRILIDSGGVVQLLIEAGGCTDTAQTTIQVDTIAPGVNLVTDVLGCSKDSVWVYANVSGSIAGISWGGPGILRSSGDSVLINQSGFYQLSVTGQNGCQQINIFQIIRDEDPPDFSLVLDTLTCLNDTIFPSVLNRIPGTQFSWLGPRGGIYTGQSPGLYIPGEYVLTATTPAGCQTDTIVELFADLREPVFSIRGDTLGCHPDSNQLEIDPIIAGYTYAWSGPSGFSSSEPDPFVRIEGDYIVTVTAENGCNRIDTLSIFRTDEVPDIIYDVSGIDCNDTSGSIQASSFSGITYQWEGPNNFSSSDQLITNLDPGIYNLTVTDANGCENTRIIELTEDLDPPQIQLQGDTINCSSITAELSFSTSDPLSSFIWILPDNSTSQDSILITGQGGRFVLLARGENGCTSEDTLVIFADTTLPVNQIIPDDINCEKDSAILKLDLYTGIDNLTWILPDATEINSDSIIVREEGEYVARIVGDNRCIFYDTIVLRVDTIPPILNFTTGEINCVDRETEIEVFPASDVLTWSISGPSGTVNDLNQWTISEAGEYIISWTGSNGCSLQDTLVVTGDTLRPEVDLFNENFDCRKQDTLAIGVDGSYPDLQFNWSGPDNFTSGSKDTLVELEGSYTVTVTADNGCTYVDSVVIGFDTLPPVWSYLPVQDLSCSQDSVDLGVLALSGDVSIAFDAPDGLLLNDSTWRTGTPGWISTLVEGENACVSIDSIFIGIDTVGPNLLIAGDTLTCLNERVRVIATPDTLGGEISWEGPGGFIANSFDPLVGEEGWYTAQYILPNGCGVTDSIFIRSEIDPPALAIQSSDLPCNGDSIVILASADTTNVIFRWTGPNGFQFDGSSPEIFEPGEYILLATGPNGCQSLDTVRVGQASNDAIVNIVADTITCDNPNVELSVSSDPEQQEYRWTGPGGFSGNGTNLLVSTPGWYYFKGLDSDGCSVLDSVNISADTSAPKVILTSDGNLGCGMDRVILSANFTGDTSGIRWSWIGPGGQILGRDQDSIIIDEAGSFLLELVNTTNGCTASDSIDISGSSNGLAVDVLISDPTCPGIEDGWIRIADIIGNNGPWEVLVNGNNEGQTTEFEALSSGNFLVSVIDSLGCQWDSTIQLLRPDTLWVDLGPDRTIDRGGSVNIDPQLNPGASGVSVLDWMPSDPSCPTCFQRVVSPLQTTSYILTVVDDRGCIASDDILITVLSDDNIFLPNAFTPNGDGVNDSWTLSIGSGIERIEELQIYDRWGELVHSLTSREAVDGMMLWDGTFRGKDLNPSVFVFRLVYQTTAGELRQRTGDVTILR